MDEAEFMRRLREAFAVEADEHLQSMSSGLIEIEKAEDPARKKELVEQVFREAHSLKGAARAVMRNDIESVCQSLESVFSQWKREGVRADPEVFDSLNRAIDFLGDLRALAAAATSGDDFKAVHEMVRTIANLGVRGAPCRTTPPTPATPPPASQPTSAPAPTPPAPSVSGVIEKVSAPVVAPVAPASPEPERLTVAESVRVPMARLDALLLKAEELVALKQLAARQAEELRTLVVTFEAWQKEWGKSSSAVRADFASAPAVADSALQKLVDWNAEQLDAVLRRVGAMAKAADHDRHFADMMVDDLLDGAKRVVMLPFERLLVIFPKQVRDLAREEGKEIDLTIRGGEVEIDKRILEEMKAPLLHLVRNAIDHGIEQPAARTEQGKPPRGRLSIQVSQREGGKIHIVIEDDGKGIDPAAVKDAALRAGTVTAAEAQQFDDAQARMLIFQSGLSTSATVTDISGRGLGMAIVREKVEKLGGQIALESQMGVGTTFRIVLPVALATFKGVLVAAGGQKFVLPTAAIERVVRVPIEEVRTVENRDTISLEGKAMSFARLADVLGLGVSKSPESGSLLEAVVLGAGDQRVAFAVEAVISEQEVLVKKLARPLVRVRNVSGATVLRSGAPVLILHAADLLQSAIRLSSSAGSVRRTLATETAKPTGARRVLVADDSVTSRMLLKNILELAGYDVTTAVDGIEAYTALHSEPFDLVCSDVDMPGMSGFDLTARIRGDEKLAHLPVILITALGSRQDQERGLDAGADAYLVKSNFDQGNLLQVIQRLL